eukprot:4537949-Ditylum_brightwellii.AAC.1
MPLLQRHWCCNAGGNENSGRSNLPPRCTLSVQEESEEASKNSPSQRPKRACANYGSPFACMVKKQSKAKEARKTAAEDNGEEKSP